MSVSVKGFVVTNHKPVFFVLALIERAVNSLIGTHREVLDANRAADEAGTGKRQSRHVDIHLRPESGMAQVLFTLNGEERALTVFFHCDSDHVDVAPKSLSMSMGAHGDAELVVKTVLGVLRVLGAVHYMNEAASQTYAQLDVAAPTFLDLVAQRAMTGYSTSLEEWLALAKSGVLDFDDVQKSLGFELAEAERLAEQDFDKAYVRIKELSGRG